jgi:AraC family cel operon transcriptional repressor
MRQLRGSELFNAYGFHIAETRLASDAPTFRHAHDFYELFLETSGQVLHMPGAQEQPLSEGALCLVRPEDEHCFRRLAARDAAFTNLAFHLDAYNEAVRIYAARAGEPDCIPVVTLSPALRLSLQARIQYLSDAAAASSVLPAGVLLVGIILDALCYLSGAGRPGPEGPLWLRRAMEAMHDAQNAQAGIARLVALSGKSQEYLSRTMRRFYNTTPSRYVNALRLSEAARFLRNTNLGVLTIQLECGFESASYFNESFRREFGMSPTKYRQQNRAAISPE